jgi:protein-S-isoprenylcysteine O-methyltransferase Ste14
MEKKHTRFSKVFGSGPAGLSISVILFYSAFLINKRIDLPPLSQNRFLLNGLASVFCLLALMVIVWSFQSLPASDRGNKLCTKGVFRYVRHPLYAAFLSLFAFGLAVYLNSFIYILWALLLHPIWHFVIRYEEKLMIDIFGEQYREYQKITGRFFPKLIMKRNHPRHTLTGKPT